MVICRLSSLLGERRLKVADVVRDTGIARATVDRYYYDTVQSYDREVLDKLCAYLKVDLPALIQYVRQPDLFDAQDMIPPSAQQPARAFSAAPPAPLAVHDNAAVYAATANRKLAMDKLKPRPKPEPKDRNRKSHSKS